MKTKDGRTLIYDWNTRDRKAARKPRKRVQFDDETLRDGLQSPSVTDPPIRDKKRALELMCAVGIDAADLGLPGAGPRAYRDVLALAKHIVAKNLPIEANCACRTLQQDIEPVTDITQKTGLPIEVAMFIGSSPIRQYAEGWTVDKMLRVSEKALDYCRREKLPVMYVTEDTTRAHPRDIKRLYSLAIDMGARRLCVCDTVGHATPAGVRELITSVIEDIVKPSGKRVRVDWHGHRDRGLSIPNTIAAIQAGANRVHGAALGIGERSGNTPMDLLLVNLKLLGWIDNDLTRLDEYCRHVSRAVKRPLPVNYPVFGEDAFMTGTGVHAAAVIKAYEKGDAWLADRVYCGVPAGDFGARQKILVGPMSGRSNVEHWFRSRGKRVSAAVVEKVFAAAKCADRNLTDAEILRAAKGAGKKAGGKKKA